MRTLAGLLRDRAESAPDIPAIFHQQDGEWTGWTWAEYWQRALQAATGLRAAGIKPGQNVLLLVIEPQQAVPLIFGCWILGATPMQAGLPYRLGDIGAFLDHLAQTAVRLDAALLVVSQALSGFGETRPSPVPVRVAELLNATDPEPDLPDPDELRGPALVQLTSGSTGQPRGVVIAHDRLLRHMAAMSEVLPIRGPGQVAVSWLPLHHDMGLIGGLFFPLWNDFPLYLLSPLAFRNRPLSWLETMSRFRGTITPGPPSAYAIAAKLADKAVAAGLDLSPWACAMIGAEPIPAALLRRFSDVYAPIGFRAEAFFPVYGLAEATVAATFPRLLTPTRVDVVERITLEREGRARPAEPGPMALELVAVGSAIPGSALRIVDETGEDLPERRVGEILLRSDSLMSGYYRDPVATEDAIQDGWLRTWDLGYLAEGQLYICGRRKEIIIKGGHNLSPAALEEIAVSVPGVRPGGAAAVGLWSESQGTESVHLVVETALEPAQHAELGHRIREALKAHGMAIDQLHLLAPGTLPKTTSGKLQRGQVRAMLER